MRSSLCLALTLCSLAACGDSSFQCAEDSQCTQGGVAGFCEVNGYCSFPDDECNTGRRYGSEASEDVAGTCVTTMAGSGVTGAASLSSGSSGAQSSDAQSSGAQSSGEPVTTSTSSGPESATSSETGSIPQDPNIMFVSSVPVPLSADLVSTADVLCNELAADAGLAGTYVAWLTTSRAAAVSRLVSARGWVRTDGRPFADRISDLAAGLVYYPPILDESGETVRGVRTFTGTGADGSSTANCSDWSESDNADITFGFGSPGATWPHWTESGSAGCVPDNSPAHVYCFGVDAEAEVAVEPLEGRRAFMSVSTKAGDGGISAFDAICAQEAEGAGLDGSFKAFLGTDTSSAMSRFDAFGAPWVNMQGVPLVEIASDLLVSEHIDAPPNFSATGTPVRGFFWTGARTAFDPGAQNHCQDWSGVGFGLHYQTSSTTDWFDDSVTQCGNQHHVLCFEE